MGRGGAAAASACTARLALRPRVAAGRARCVRARAQDDFKDYVLDLQSRILAAGERIESSSGAKFLHDRWERDPADPSAGFGITCVLEDGDVLEKAAANVSIIEGVLTPERAQAMSSRGRASIDPAGGQPYAAAAMSLVFHSKHPFVPTLRADVRLFRVGGEEWYGGGCDLTPSYLDEADARAFHAHWRGVCDQHSPALYPEYKAWCDKYFYIPARKEHRGVGGIFFDDLASSADLDAAAFTRDVGDNIIPSWEPIVERHRHDAYTDEHRNWQLLRRGRYLEFNLLYDRGVKFGLNGGRFESIMVSAPPLIRWKYNAVPEEGSPEWETLEVLRNPREWA
ncbi:unnamed protein product [Pedinophyceae sp. YPF-701]|nr:unnamed protein product [Pedinophyceae sp. YPF-701]